MKFDASTSVLDLLKAGCSLKLPNGYELEGDPATGYIQLLTPAFDSRSPRDDGVCNLSQSGLDEAFNFALKFDQN